jgi:diguanylate cyclase (GGDEF)-like protein
VHIDTEQALSDIDHQLLDVFCANVAVGLDNVQLFSRLNESVFVDPLTRLPNRNRLIALLDERCKNAPASTTFALVDIDDFADINDALGHVLGDSLLQAVADRLTRALRAPVVVGRVAGDVFGVVGPDVQVNPATLAAQFVLPFECQQESLQITATIGFVRLADSSGQGTEVLKDANIALKRSKTRRRGGHGYYTQDMGADIRERVKLLRDLRSAFEGEQLFVMYQPQIQLSDGAVVGAEALIRWRTEDGQLVPSDRFIPVAEYSGLIVNIGEWVLHTACHELKRLNGLGHPDFRMAVNVSVAQLRHPDYVATLQQALADSGVAPDRIELEITESMAMEDVGFVVQILEQIKQTGVTIAIDDFGTGFSSLSQLRHLHVDRLKIDRAFVNEIIAIDQGCDIARMVVELARSLHLEVIAEGIETEEQASVLRELGCHEGQGYLIARPMEPAQLEAWLKERLPAAA